MPLQNFVDFLPPSVKAAWLNAVDVLKFTVFNDAATKPAARTALELDPQLVAEGTDSGAANAAIVTLVGPVTNYIRAVGSKVSFTAAAVNTGATTLNVNGTGVAAVLAQDGTACTGGELFTPVIVEWTGTTWKIVGGGIPLENRRTAAEITAAIIPTNYAYPTLYVDRYSSVQTALNALLAIGGYLQFSPDKTYALGATSLTLTRTAIGNATRMFIEGNGAVLTFATLSGSNAALTIGADGSSNFVEGGLLGVRNLRIQGPETTVPSSSSPTTSTIGLNMQFAGSVYLENVKCPGFRDGFRTKFVFPLTAVNCSGRGSWNGTFHDEASNLQRWVNFEAPNTRYAHVVKSESTSLDSGKSNNITWENSWIEGANVGWSIDSGSGGAGAVRYRSFVIISPYVSNVTYDVVRIGTVYTFTTPSVRGANCSEFINDFRMTDGLWNPTGGNWTATSAAIAYDSVQRVRHALIDLPIVSKEADTDVFVNGPAGGVVRTKAFPGVADGIVTEYLYSNIGAIVRRFNPNGNILLGDQKATPGSLTEIGVELKNGGNADFTTTSDVALRLNRKTTTGTIQSFFQAENIVGAVNVNLATITIVVDVTNNVIIATGNASPEGSVTANVGSIYLRNGGGAGTSFYVKESGAGNTGWVAK